MRQLSFASASSPAASQPEQDSLVKKASFDPAPPSQSEQCFFGSASAQASIWMTDCFSSVFSDSATESMALANQLSCLVAENKLQITDTDFAKQFKALARNKLIELRNQWQAHSCVSSGSNG